MGADRLNESGENRVGSVGSATADNSGGGLRGSTTLQRLRFMPWFWVGCFLKLACAAFFGSHFATRWFAPFLHQFVELPFTDPWQAFLLAGEPQAFPYGPGMLLSLSPGFWIAAAADFDPSSNLGLLLLRMPLLVADIVVCVTLMKWIPERESDVVFCYWLNPIVFFASYLHGQLDLIPTAMLCLSLLLMFTRREYWAGIVFGIGLATKLHLLVALPFCVLYLWRKASRRRAAIEFIGAALAIATLLYAPVMDSPAFVEMVFGTPETARVWNVTIPYGPSGPSLYVAPAYLAVGLLVYASYRKVNRDLTLMFIGAVYTGLVALVPPQPGWFIWFIPFVSYLWVRFPRSRRFSYPALSVFYLAYFFFEDTAGFIEMLDPSLGAGFGIRVSDQLSAAAPSLFTSHVTSVVWTALFGVTALAAAEMYRKGVRSNAFYRYRDKSFLIGIGGDSGAGKHTLGSDLARALGPEATIINGDDDHKWERGHAMWRKYTHLDPRGNELTAQLDTLAALRQGGQVHKRHYDHGAGRFTAPLTIRPTDFIAIVGLHPFFLASQRELLELKIYVDPTEDLRRRWKIRRDAEKRGYSEAQVLDQIERRMPDSLRFVRPQMKFADVVLRLRDSSEERPELTDMEMEVSNTLNPLRLIDALERLGTVESNWTPSEDLTRDRISVLGTIDADQVRALIAALVPNPEELVVMEPTIQGGRGLQLVVILYAISVRMRITGANEEV